MHWTQWVQMAGGPQSLAGLGADLWWRADVPSSITKDGSDLVSSWVDVVASRNATSAGSGAGQRPTWVAAVVNGMPFIRWVATSNMRLQAPIGTFASTDITIAVMTRNITGSPMGIFDSTDASGLTNIGHMVRQQSTLREFFAGSLPLVNYAWGGSGGDVRPVLTICQRQGTAARLYAATDIETLTLKDSDTLVGTAPPTFTQIRIGALFQDVWPITGDIAELAVWQADGAVDLATVYPWFKTRYALA